MKNNSTVKFNFLPAAGIRWLRNLNEVIIINGNLSKRWTLQDTEADVWEWLWQEFNQSSIIKMIALMNHLTENQAQQLFNEISARWKDQGWIQT